MLQISETKLNRDNLSPSAAKKLAESDDRDGIPACVLDAVDDFEDDIIPKLESLHSLRSSSKCNHFCFLYL